MAGSLLGGPMAMVYLLWKNFQVLENPHGMRQILIWGSIFIVTMVGFAPLLPTNWPDYALPILYSVGARSLAESFQMSKQAIGEFARLRISIRLERHCRLDRVFARDDRLHPRLAPGIGGNRLDLIWAACLRSPAERRINAAAAVTCR